MKLIFLSRKEGEAWKPGRWFKCSLFLRAVLAFSGRECPIRFGADKKLSDGESDTGVDALGGVGGGGFWRSQELIDRIYT